LLERQQPALALRTYMDELREVAGDVSVMLDPPRQQIELTASDRSKGPGDAPVVIVEFSDFECPFCGRATATLAALMDRYPDRIRFVYKDFPLPNHPNAFKAAEAGHCAHDQGMFWELHDRMFAVQDALDVDSLKSYADELGLDADEFNACLDDGRHAESVDREMAAGRSYGATSTPTLFINGRPILGALPLDVFDRIVRQELDAAARR
jgi:protein-disulfide isomerase